MKEIKNCKETWKRQYMLQREEKQSMVVLSCGPGLGRLKEEASLSLATCSYLATY